MKRIPAGSDQMQNIKDNLKNLKFHGGGQMKKDASKEVIIKSSEENGI